MTTELESLVALSREPGDRALHDCESWSAGVLSMQYVRHASTMQRVSILDCAALDARACIGTAVEPRTPIQVYCVNLTRAQAVIDSSQRRMKRIVLKNRCVARRQRVFTNLGHQ